MYYINGVIHIIMILVNLNIQDCLFFWPTDGTYTAIYVNVYTEKGEVTVDEILTAASDMTFDLENGNTLVLHEKYNISVAKINGKYIWISSFCKISISERMAAENIHLSVCLLVWLQTLTLYITFDIWYIQDRV